MMPIKQFQAQWDSNDSEDYRAWLNALMSRLPQLVITTSVSLKGSRPSSGAARTQQSTVQ